jgi:hypothetical protein
MLEDVNGIRWRAASEYEAGIGQLLQGVVEPHALNGESAVSSS